MIRITLTIALLACSISGFRRQLRRQHGQHLRRRYVGLVQDDIPDDKVVPQARDDAASFVASDGRIRGAQLEAALRHLRERNAGAQRASDMQLAQAILAL